MSASLLTSAFYEQSSRLAHLKLNTIIEEFPEEPEAEETRGRSRTPSCRNVCSGSPALSTSTISSYYQRSRGSREFDDLYDATDSESDQDSIEIPQCHTRKSSKDSVLSKKASLDNARRNRYPSLVIPSPTSWPTIEKFQKDSALAMAQSATIPLSPEVLAKLNAKAQASSNLPSLDGSLLSEHIANCSSPATPKESNHLETIKNWQRMLVTSIYSNDEIEFDADVETLPPHHSSMLLSPEAFDVLQKISLEQEVEEVQQEMQEICIWAEPAIKIEAEPMSAVSEYSISQISLPSPGGLLGPDSSDAAWFMIAPIPTESASPTFSSVEEFYNSSCSQALTRSSPASPKQEQLDGAFAEPLFTPQVLELLDVLGQEPSFSTTAVADRTSDWLCAQDAWLVSVRESTPTAKVETPSTPVTQTSSTLSGTPESVVKRAVHFLQIEDTEDEDQVASRSASEKGDPLFYHAFQRLSMAASPTDSFVHRHSRFDAIQAQRTSLQLNYVNSLLGNYRSTAVYRPAPKRPISMMPGKESDNNLDDEEKQYFSALEREREATEQLAPAMWVVEALRYLSGGSLFNSPVAAHLSSAPTLDSTPLPEHVRVLDLGGQPQCDWAWHCAQDYPQVKTYTAILHTQLHNPSLHGPSNHRLVSVDNFYTLPFPANHFDAISARSLAMYLHTTKPLGAEIDEYDLCLKECLRVLKPGGYLEFFLLDADIITSTPDSLATAPQAPLASKLSIEFSFSLSQHGYDPCPTKSFLSRLRRNGFSSIKRAWMFLPIGGETEVLSSMPETPPPTGASSYDEGIFSKSIEAVQGPVGCTKDAAAVSGLVGGWMWESWVVKLAKEMGRDGYSGLVGDVGGVVEEGRRAGGGWRVLRGWGRKPL
ncbi:MAG: hypothetical protein GOMPHAMPRED_002542 [Gomphillus americanus]|uniref:Methyltransferase type 11 domain-containing protein n=1 Tax=Gomphillus americanus TaxID=1940652 RepID=A0A8H3IBX8_9LECA|nr:MAG: hypothetical protein GOMPHAMPRED_002542 [Gomphillus americanus]